MLFMIWCRRPSTSSRVQPYRRLFCDISRPETATPPAFAAFAGPYRILASRNCSTPSSVVGIDAPERVVVEPRVARRVRRALERGHVLLDAPAAHVLEILHPRQLLPV